MQNNKMHKNETPGNTQNEIPVSERGEREFIKNTPLL